MRTVLLCQCEDCEKAVLFFIGDPSMLKSCKYCGKIHPEKYQCPMKPKRSRMHDYSDRAVWKFRHGEGWKQKAIDIKERDHWMCQWCLKQNKIITKDLSVHHIVPLEEDMELRLDDDNLITLCRACHEQAEKGSITRAELKEVALSQGDSSVENTPVI